MHDAEYVAPARGHLKSEIEGCVTNAKARGGGHGLFAEFQRSYFPS
jgi:hypothetical protein